MFSNRRGIVLITLIIWIVVIGVIIVYVPQLYDWYVEQNTIKIIKSNIESVENEIKSELIDRHPVLIWNDMDNVIKSLNIQNPVTKAPQVRNGFNTPGDVVVSFDGESVFTLDGIGPDSNMLRLNKVIEK